MGAGDEVGREDGGDGVMKNGACIDCVYLANDNKWCAKIGDTVGAIRVVLNCYGFVWKGEKASAARKPPASFLAREMELEEYE